MENHPLKRYTTTMTERGQVTLPADVRRLLGIKPKEKVTFEVEGNEIRLTPPRFTVESVRGSVPALSERKSLEEIYQEAGDEYARHVLGEMNGSQE